MCAVDRRQWWPTPCRQSQWHNTMRRERQTGIDTCSLSNWSTQPDPKLVVAMIVALRALLQQEIAMGHFSKVVHTLPDIHRIIAVSWGAEQVNWHSTIINEVPNGQGRITMHIINMHYWRGRNVLHNKDQPEELSTNIKLNDNLSTKRTIMLLQATHGTQSNITSVLCS